MDAITAIETRRTTAKLAEPAPAAAALARAFRAAASAPDHKRLRPWRFLVIEGEARQKFGALLVESLLNRQPDAGPELVRKEAGKALRAPMIVVCAAAIRPNEPGAPVVEQILATGAATQNFMLALHAQGFGTSWKTGPAAYCPIVRAKLGLRPEDQIVGFIYAGSVAEAPLAATPPAADTFVKTWTGPVPPP